MLKNVEKKIEKLNRTRGKRIKNNKDKNCLKKSVKKIKKRKSIKKQIKQDKPLEEINIKKIIKQTD